MFSYEETELTSVAINFDQGTWPYQVDFLDFDNSRFNLVLDLEESSLAELESDIDKILISYTYKQVA